MQDREIVAAARAVWKRFAERGNEDQVSELAEASGETKERANMPKINVIRYDHPEGAAGFVGYVEPEDRTWFVSIDTKGRARFFPDRTLDGGVEHSGFGPQWDSPADELLSIVRRWLDGPPVHPPGSLVAGSTAEDRAVDKWTDGMRDRLRHLLTSPALSASPYEHRVSCLANAIEADL